MTLPLRKFLVAASLAAASAVIAGEALPSSQPTVASIPDSLAVAEFTPPAPIAPKEVPAMRIDAATTVRAANGKNLTILLGEASTLPDLPAKPESMPVVPRVRTADDAAREIFRRRHSLNFGATIYDRRASVVRWQHPDTGEAYEALCGFDIGLIAGLGRFVRGDENYSVMLMHSRIDTTRPRKVHLPNVANLAAVSADSITYLKGDPTDPIGIFPITLVKELIANEKSRLEIFQADLARHQSARVAWEKANPEPPRDETLWIRPHRGSRYLADPNPEGRTR